MECGNSGAPVAFKTWWGHQYRVGKICPPPVGIGLRWLPKHGVDMSPRPHAHRRACLKIHEKITKIKVQKKYMNKISTNVRVRVRLAQN